MLFNLAEVECSIANIQTIDKKKQCTFVIGRSIMTKQTDDFHTWYNLVYNLCRKDLYSFGVVLVSDGIQGVRTGSREPVLAMPGYSANPFLLFVIDLLIHAAILSEPVLTFCYSLFETAAYSRRIEN